MEEVVSITISSWNHMIHVPYFWASMGFTTAIAMFVGPLFFNGNVGLSVKALLAKLLFAGMMFWFSVSQIIDARVNHPELLTPGVKAVSYVVALNVVAVTFAWVMGFFLGIVILWLKKNKKI